MWRVIDDPAGRLADATTRDDLDALLDLECDLADAGRQEDAERCFRRASEYGSALALFILGKSLRELGRPLEAVAAYEAATKLARRTPGEILAISLSN